MILRGKKAAAAEGKADDKSAKIEGLIQALRDGKEMKGSGGGKATLFDFADPKNCILTAGIDNTLVFTLPDGAAEVEPRMGLYALGAEELLDPEMLPITHHGQIMKLPADELPPPGVYTVRLMAGQPGCDVTGPLATLELTVVEDGEEKD